MQTKAGLATTPAGGRMTGPHPGAAREHKYKVTPLELFFDLAFVFGVSQLSHHLLTELSWRGAGQTLVMLVAILTVWSYTSGRRP
jgi:low temperature requirement protein LtrA